MVKDELLQSRPPGCDHTCYQVNRQWILQQPPIHTQAIPRIRKYQGVPSQLGMGRTVCSQQCGTRGKITFSSQYGFERNHAPGSQGFEDQRNKGTPTPPPVVQVRKRQATTRTTQRQKTKTPPPLVVQQSASSLPHQNGPQYKEPPRANPSSTPMNSANGAQLA
jgi:hypothetical protein